MRKTFLKLTEWTKSALNTLSNHVVTIFTAIILSVFFLTSWVFQEIGHFKEVMIIQKEKAVLVRQLDQMNRDAEDLFTLTEGQSELIQKYQDTLQKSGSIIYTQEEVIKQLINYLKSIGHWPPKMEPETKRDPKNWT